ncbi:uncharacterized protein LOC130745458 isoform X2 [Lotus japonicus]|uniref:uncharacterized protein LOC130745458 isoform X2 n=1 Tax=Lotus japonicus TaxID=34305 RepID=UPI002584CB49|nr:uncharacterized protein LOC130745458 isoform X2 [Lotus japonicus]XP_057453721.1 uncharacterized protein LOC130745458 isoform X2 [Lotus japonicus]XP_057453722.1 uncharacterized protein LOC130745458 isoform X2 [Lotus japonicus]XP_057453723.1 uncharacterized protein LOC130745458 isoform X2 [Lotus japonicus]XP_057453724.1 uncharacterized protein LOC130745458 isoform X2 [Lotus japonicus]
MNAGECPYNTETFFLERFLQEESLQRLQKRIDVPYDSSIVQHQDALRALWNAAFPEEKLHGLISEQWKEMGWQGKDPSTYLGVVVLYHWRTFCSFLGISRN